MEEIKNLIQQYKDKIIKNEEEIPRIKKLPSREMTLSTKTVHINSREYENRTLTYVINDLEQLLNGGLIEMVEFNIGDQYSVEENVSFDQYTMYKGDVLEVQKDRIASNRLCFTNKNGFNFVANPLNTSVMIASGRLKKIDKEV